MGSKKKFGVTHDIKRGLDPLSEYKHDAKPHICIYCHEKRQVFKVYSKILKRFIYACSSCKVLISGRKNVHYRKGIKRRYVK